MRKTPRGELYPRTDAQIKRSSDGSAAVVDVHLCALITHVARGGSAPNQKKISILEKRNDFFCPESRYDLSQADSDPCGPGQAGQPHSALCLPTLAAPLPTSDKETSPSALHANCSSPLHPHPKLLPQNFMVPRPCSHSCLVYFC